MAIEVTSTGYQPPRYGFLLLYGLIGFLFLLFVLRFWYLQIINGPGFSQQAVNNRIQSQLLHTTRGIIFDTNGVLLAENRPAYCIAITRSECPNLPSTLAQISQWTNQPLESLEAKLDADPKTINNYAPLLLVNDLPFETVAAIEQNLYQWPGVSIVIRQRRYYPYTDLLSHILGYVAEANRDELTPDTTDLAFNERVVQGDRIGKQGIEYTWEKELKGQKGFSIVEVDALSRQLGVIDNLPPEPGKNLYLSIDLKLQQACLDALNGEAGTVIVMEPYSGKVLAMVSSPAYDNNLFTTKLSLADWEPLRDNPRAPMQNRAIQSMYPPGSVWKMIMLGTFLEHGIDPKETVTCSGSYKVGRHTFRCWNDKGHGVVNMNRALTVSCDVYFYELSQRVKIENIERFAKACGFGKPTGVDLPQERSGLVPGKELKKRLHPKNSAWQVGDTINTSIGQGFTLVTPIQMATFISALINDGKLLKPSLVRDEPPIETGQIPIPAQHRNFILDAMKNTVEQGTARRIKRADATIGGKTGTAQVKKLGERRQRSHEMKYLHRDHAWLTSWGIKDGNTYVVVVMVEHGGGGSSAAGPVTQKVYEALFNAPTEPPQDAPDIADDIGEAEVGAHD